MPSRHFEEVVLHQNVRACRSYPDACKPASGDDGIVSGFNVARSVDGLPLAQGEIEFIEQIIHRKMNQDGEDQGGADNKDCGQSFHFLI
jgi:hypothetical protein